MAKKVTARNLKKVLKNLGIMALKDTEDCTIICDSVNEMLDGLLDSDFFGTEGQCDPRGDQRDEA